jgi:hypothetical protein
MVTTFSHNSAEITVDMTSHRRDDLPELPRRGIVTAPAAWRTPALFGSSEGRVRQLEARDLEQVACLFLRTFRRDGRARAQRVVDDVASYMRRLYLEGPYSGAGTGALAQVDGGGYLSGFLSILKSRYLLEGQQLSASVIRQWRQGNPRRLGEAQTS